MSTGYDVIVRAGGARTDIAGASRAVDAAPQLAS